MRQVAVMTEAHTPEPWIYSVLGNGIHAGDISICQFHNRFGTDFPNFDANARRVVACVNACAGRTTEELEDIAILRGHLSIAAAAIDMLTRSADPEWEHESGIEAYASALDKARSALSIIRKSP